MHRSRNFSGRDPYSQESLLFPSEWKSKFGIPECFLNIYLGCHTSWPFNPSIGIIKMIYNIQIQNSYITSIDYHIQSIRSKKRTCPVKTCKKQVQHRAHEVRYEQPKYPKKTTGHRTRLPLLQLPSPSVRLLLWQLPLPHGKALPPGGSMDVNGWGLNSI